MLIIPGIIVSSIILWYSSEKISKCSEVIGRGWGQGVRGATINAISSSLPELFTAAFFLLALGQVQGFLSGLSTMAGSAVYNALVIPGLMGIVSLWKLKKGLPEHDRKLVWRDGLWLLGCQGVVLLFIRTGHIGWMESGSLLLLYAVYIALLNRARKHHSNVVRALPRATKIKAYRNLAINVTVVGIACYFLVECCVQIGERLGWSLAILGLLVAASATSIPDTLLSVRDAWRGQLDDGISNALGSNIFDLCVALGLPVLIYSLTTSPIQLDPPTIDSLTAIWLAMIGLTLLAIAAMLSGKRLKGIQITAMMAGYLIFLGLVISGLLPV